MATPQFGFDALWAQSDGVIKGVALMLFVMSVASWYVIVTKAIAHWRLRRMAAQAAGDFWHAGSLRDGVKSLRGDARSNPFVDLARTSLSATLQHHQATNAGRTPPVLSDWLVRALRERISRCQVRMQSGMPVLATVGSSAPFIGLFGTVWGIYHALMTIGASGQASIGEVAGPVGETLVMTALGLAVAIPASLAYNALLRANKTSVASLSEFSYGLHDMIVAGQRLPDDGETGGELHAVKAGESGEHRRDTLPEAA
ncbi:MotA/TolQ/ExbB proton channel family protein [Pandoraea bronchicola]|uniref:Biopolymer transport protein ExbB n=1 Tax=Pandoraea bronchicola TaxID=2508287 RepID=A0A5E5C1P4_9BURK|nr:MotA/TolQ/ExbB proton channel family protein [Pandoraea bronchicola]VVE90473.1 Biopolymer transport protein ExbB [Pandoraea bronchicola]